MAMEDRINPIGMIMTFPGVTQEQYEAVLQQLNLGGRMPPGGIFHAAGPVEGGWRVVACGRHRKRSTSSYERSLNKLCKMRG